MKFEIKYTEDALEDLDAFRKYDQTLILDTIDRQLMHQLSVETRNRKRLRPDRVSNGSCGSGDSAFFRMC
jgi:uncharacterized protein with von Willebrand factor type A (vWA) domain